jgi:hypothetical protein
MTDDLRHRASSVFLFLALLIVPRVTLAQSDAGITVAGLLSLQPVNDTYIGNPYLDAGIGGVAPGISVGADFIAANGFAAIGEVSTTLAFEQVQTGRLVWANRSNFSHEGTATTRLRDTLVSALAGYAVSTATSHVVVSGGLSYVRTTLKQDELVVEDQVGDFGLGGKRRFAPTVGLDWRRRLSGHVAMFASARYAWLGRAEVADQTGAGEHIVRVGAGLRVRIDD